MRNVTKIIIHCTATPEGREVTVNEVTRWHLSRGFQTIGYHYLIYLDGTVHVGRPIETPGAHTEGHNANSVGVCYVGGLDKAMKPKDTRTPAQKAALLSLVRGLKIKYPSATIHGHKEFANKACPSFDVQKENWT